MKNIKTIFLLIFLTDNFCSGDVGLEPLINFPITASLDYKPGIDILGGWTDSWSDVAFSVRYAF